MGFGPLRVLNQDIIQAGAGFPSHPHSNMEIVTYVLQGTLEHKDSMGNGSRIHAGDVQIMGAGSGVTHSEFNPSDKTDLHLLQMWILPRRHNTRPRYAQVSFSELGGSSPLQLAISPDGERGSINIDQDASMLLGNFKEESSCHYELLTNRMAWLHVARGRLLLEGRELRTGDAAALSETGRYSISSLEPSDMVLWEFPMDQSTSP